MNCWKSRLRYTTFCTAVLCAAIMPAYAGSGSLVYDMQYTSQFGSSGSGDGQFNYVGQAVLNGNGQILVADYTNNRVQGFDRNGNYISQFGNGQIGNPIPLHVAADGNILVGGWAGHSVTMFDTTYTQQNVFPVVNTVDGIAISPNGEIYISSSNGGDVQVFDSNYNYLRNVGSPGNNPGEFSSPRMISFAPDGRYYVADVGNSNVQIFNADDTFNSLLPFLGGATNGIDVDANGNLYVLTLNGIICVYDNAGNVLYNYTNAGSSKLSILASDDGRVYVSDTGNDRVQILTFTSTETFTGAPGGGNEVAATPLSNLILNNGGVFADDFIGYNNVDINGTSWTLGGNNDFAGTVNVTADELINNSTLTGATITTASNTVLSGIGSYVGNLTNNGTIDPGAVTSREEITITGDYTHEASAVYRVDVNTMGQSDRLSITGAAVLNGGTVNVFAENGTYSVNNNYLILMASSGVTGTFGTVNSNLAFLTPTLDYSNSNLVLLQLTRNDGIDPYAPVAIDFSPYASSGNQSGAIAALSQYSASQFDGDTNTFNKVLAFNTEEAKQFVSEVTPEEIASLPQVQQSVVSMMQSPLFSRMNTLRPNRKDQQSFAFFTPAEIKSAITPDQVWLEAVGGFSSQQADLNATGFRLGTAGMRGGVDKMIDNNNLVGVSIAHARATVDYKASADKSSTQYTHLDLYGKHHSLDKNLVLEGIVGVGGGRVDSMRQIAAGGLGLTANGNTNAYDVTGSIKASTPIALQASTLIPNITATASWQRQNSFSESGAGPFNLRMDNVHSTPVTISPMINWQKTIYSKNNKFSLTPDLGIGATWQMNELDRSVNARFSSATATQGFTTAGSKQQPLSLNVTAAVTMIPFTENTVIPSLTATTTLQSNNATKSGTATLNAKWVW